MTYRYIKRTYSDNTIRIYKILGKELDLDSKKKFYRIRIIFDDESCGVGSEYYITFHKEYDEYISKDKIMLEAL